MSVRFLGREVEMLMGCAKAVEKEKMRKKRVKIRREDFNMVVVVG